MSPAFWAAPEERALAIGRRGEVVAANMRLAVIAAVVFLPIGHIIFEPPDLEPWIGLSATLVLLVFAIAARAHANRPAPYRFLGSITSLLDITLISAALATFVATGEPLAATNGRVFFSAYLLALSLVCLRQDVRLMMLCGVVAIVQYGAIVWWAFAAYDLNGPTFAASGYGAFRWGNQITRLILLAMATMVDVAIVDQSRAYLKASIRDSLTGLANRDYAQDRLADAIALARRGRHTVVIALVDIDEFKLVNDRYGHAAGDTVLQRSAELMRASFRASDVVARYGGEEFLIIFTQTEATGAIERVEHFRAAFAAHFFEINGVTVPASLTVSIGIAAWPADAHEAAELVQIADRRLYEAKRAGRNRISGPTATDLLQTA